MLFSKYTILKWWMNKIIKIVGYTLLRVRQLSDGSRSLWLYVITTSLNFLNWYCSILVQYLYQSEKLLPIPGKHVLNLDITGIYQPLLQNLLIWTSIRIFTNTDANACIILWCHPFQINFSCGRICELHEFYANFD